MVGGRRWENLLEKRKCTDERRKVTEVCFCVCGINEEQIGGDAERVRDGQRMKRCREQERDGRPLGSQH